MGVEVAVIRALAAFAVRALVHVGPQQLFEQISMHSHKALSTAGTVRHSHLKLYPGNVPDGETDMAGARDEPAAAA